MTTKFLAYIAVVEVSTDGVVYTLGETGISDSTSHWYWIVDTLEYATKTKVYLSLHAENYTEAECLLNSYIDKNYPNHKKETA